MSHHQLQALTPFGTCQNECSDFSVAWKTSVAGYVSCIPLPVDSMLRSTTHVTSIHTRDTLRHCLPQLSSCVTHLGRQMLLPRSQRVDLEEQQPERQTKLPNRKES